MLIAKVTTDIQRAVFRPSSCHCYAFLRNTRSVFTPLVYFEASRSAFRNPGCT